MKIKTCGAGLTKQMLVAMVALCLSMTPAISASSKDVKDSDITGAVNTELWADNAVSANQIDVSTANGVVTLSGTVESILVKERAQAIVEMIVGVRAIINRIAVEPVTQRSDNELAQAVESAWLTDPAADSYELRASAKDGVVTLKGDVDSYAERKLSETVAKGVRGVTGVKNEIDVIYKEDRLDREIQNEIEARLENDIRVDDALVSAEVNDGTVTLTGTVGSLWEKNRAAADAWVAGVTAVNSDELDIEWWARDSMRRKRTLVSRTDPEIKAAVEDAFLYDPRVSSFNPQVEVSGGSVTLSGKVMSLAAKKAAEQDAMNTLGVWRVKNHLKVRPEIPDNEELKTRVADALLEDPYVERYDVTVDAYHGWVTLLGAVTTSFERYRAEQVTENVRGVVGVENNLTYNYSWIWKPDWEIRADIRDELAWSALLDDDDINVRVEDGVVTLSGTVDSWSEKDEAEKNAYQGGAKDVRNFLLVRYGYYGPYGPGYYASPNNRGNMGY